MALYNWSDLTGKAIVLKQDAQVRLIALRSSPVVRTVKAGDVVGVLYSWLSPSFWREGSWLQFMDIYGYPYYVEVAGELDLSAMNQQGVYTIQQIQDQAADKSLMDQVKNLMFIGLGLYIVYAAVKNFFPVISSKLIR